MLLKDSWPGKLTLQPLGVVRLHADCEVTGFSAPSGLCCAEADGQTTLIVVEYNLDRILKLHLQSGTSVTATSAQELGKVKKCQEVPEVVTLWCHQTWLATENPLSMEVFDRKITDKWSLFHCHV